MRTRPFPSSSRFAPLAFAHAKGVVHRDIKPANVMIDTESHVKVADFGLARLVDPGAEQLGHTMTGTVMGTPEYMAPEQMEGMNVDQRADIYSVGVMLYEMLCRQVPKGIFLPPSNRTGCDVRIDEIVVKAMQQAPDHRYQSTTEMKAAVAAARFSVPASPAAPEPSDFAGLVAASTVSARNAAPAPAVRKLKASLYGGLAAGVLVLALGGYFALRSKPDPLAQPQVSAAQPAGNTERAPIETPPAPPSIPSATPGVASTSGTDSSSTKPAPATSPRVADEGAKAAPTPLAVATTPAPVLPPAGPVVAPPSPSQASPSQSLPPRTTPVPAAAPPPATPTPAPADPRLAQLEAAFKARHDSDAQKPFLAAVAALNQSYLVNGLARARTAAQAKGSLAEVTALDAEKDAILEGENVPPADADGTPDSLKPLRATYRAAMTKYLAERTRASVQVYDLYLGALDAYVVELTRANKIEEARKAKALRDDVAAKKAETSAVAAAATAAAPSPLPKPATTTADRTTEVKPAGGSHWHDSAQWLATNGGSCKVAKGSTETDVKTVKDIPAGKFDIVELTFDRLNSPRPLPSDADFQVFNGIKTLRRVTVRTPGLSDAAFAFLDGNKELTYVNFEGVNDLTDGVLPHIAASKKITMLSITYAPGLTGKGLDKLACLPALTNVDFMGARLGDEGLKALTACKSLAFLRIDKSTFTDAGLVSLVALPALHNLSILNCPGITDQGFSALRGSKSLTDLRADGTAFGDSAAAAVADLKNIINLSLKNTQLTDAGLARLTVLTKLGDLQVSDTKVTEEGIAAFQKALPKCRVKH